MTSGAAASPDSGRRKIVLVTNTGRPGLRRHAHRLVEQFGQAGLEVALVTLEAATEQAVGQVAEEFATAIDGAELVCVLGGDGTILRAADIARGSGVPLLGVNFGHVGFLAEAEREALSTTVEQIVAGSYTVEERMTLEVIATDGGVEIARSWALNEVTVEKAARERMLELILEIDDRPLSTWGCDGVIMATPTGSTAYAFSAGGPVVWPDVEALLLVPISAHALFARPLVVGPDSRVAIELVPGTEGRGVMWCDGARPVSLPPEARVEVRRSCVPVRLARLSSAPFTDRLVTKFALSVQGWRGRGVGSLDDGDEDADERGEDLPWS